MRKNANGTEIEIPGQHVRWIGTDGYSQHGYFLKTTKTWWGREKCQIVDEWEKEVFFLESDDLEWYTHPCNAREITPEGKLGRSLEIIEMEKKGLIK